MRLRGRPSAPCAGPRVAVCPTAGFIADLASRGGVGSSATLSAGIWARPTGEDGVRACERARARRAPKTALGHTRRYGEHFCNTHSVRLCNSALLRSPSDSGVGPHALRPIKVVAWKARNDPKNLERTRKGSMVLLHGSLNRRLRRREVLLNADSVAGHLVWTVLCTLVRHSFPKHPQSTTCCYRL